MHTVSLLDAKTHFSQIVDEIVSGRDDSVVVSRHGKPVVKIVPILRPSPNKRIGVARGEFVVPENIDIMNPIIEELFSGMGDDE